MTNSFQVVLIGGASHVGKSSLGKALAGELNGKYIATDSLARHPGRPWTNEEVKIVKPHVVEHYRNLSVPELVSNVLKHYRHSVVPQVESLIQTHQFTSPDKYLVIEGSAIYPSLVAELVNRENIRGIWLTASHSLLKNRIYHSSNFYHSGKAERYVIYQFLGRTWLFNRGVINDAQSRGLTIIDVSLELLIGELLNKCLLEISRS